VVGVLISRAIFELHHIEPRRSSRIDPPSHAPAPIGGRPAA
jgi:hypothetical protein